MKKVVKKLKQSLSILLAVAMVVTCVPQTAALAFAASDTELTDAIDADESTEAETPAGSDESEVSTDEPAIVSDDAEEVPADETEQPDMADDDAIGEDTEVELTEEGPEIHEGPVLNLDKGAGDSHNISFEADEEQVKLGSDNAATFVESQGGGTTYDFEVNPNPGYRITSISAYKDSDKDNDAEDGADPWAAATAVATWTAAGGDDNTITYDEDGCIYSIAETLLALTTGENTPESFTIVIKAVKEHEVTFKISEEDKANITSWTYGIDDEDVTKNSGDFDDIIKVSDNSTLKIKLESAENCNVTVKRDGEAVEAEDGVYTFANITADTTITVSTEKTTPEEYIITFDITGAEVKIVKGDSSAEPAVDGEKVNPGDTVTFTVKPLKEDGGEVANKLRYVNTKPSAEGAMTAKDEKDGVYTYEYTLGEDAAAKTTIYVSATPLQDIALVLNFTGAGADAVTVKQVTGEGTADKPYVLGEAVTDSITAKEGSSVLLVIEPTEASLCKVASVAVSYDEKLPEVKEITIGEGEAAETYSAYVIEFTEAAIENGKINIGLELDDTKANIANFVLKDSTVSVNAFTVETAGEVYRVGERLLTADSEISFLINAGSGYEISDVAAVWTGKENNEDKEMSEKLEADEDGIYTLIFKPEDNKRDVTVTVDVSVSSVKGDATVSFNKISGGIHSFEVKETEKVSNRTGNIYDLKEGAQLVEFTVFALENYTPAVSYEGYNEDGYRDNIPVPTPAKGAAESKGTGKAKVTVYPYVYSVPAVVLGSKGVITIDAKPATKKLDITYNIDEVEVSVKQDGEFLESLEYITDEQEPKNIIGERFAVPVNSDATLVIAPKSNCEIITAEYKIGSGASKNVTADVKKKGEFKLPKSSDNADVTITSKANYAVEIWESDGSKLEAVNGVYTVDYASQHGIGVLKGTIPSKIADVEVTQTNASDAEKAQMIIRTEEMYFVDLKLFAADAGKTVKLKLTLGEGESAEEKTLVFNVLPQVKKLTIKGITLDSAGKGTLSQDADIRKEYPITLDPKTANMGNLDVEILPAGKAEPNDDDIAAANALLDAEIKDGSLAVITKPLKDNKAADNILGKAVIRVVDKNLQSGVEGYVKAEITVSITAPKALKDAAPVASVKSATDTTLTLSLGLGKAKVENPLEGGLWYQVTVTADANEGNSKLSDEEYEKISNAVGTFYIKKDAAAATQDATLKVSNAALGEGKAWGYKLNVKLVQLVDKTDLSTVDPDLAYGLRLSTVNAKAEGKSADGITAFESLAVEVTKDAQTRTPYYETKLKLKKGTTTVYTGQQMVPIATLQFSNETTYRYAEAKDISVYPYNNFNLANGEPLSKDGEPGSGMVNLEVKDGIVYMSVDGGYYYGHDEEYGEDLYMYNAPITGSHTIRVTAHNPGDTYPVSADIKVTVVRGINALDVVPASTVVYKPAGKAATLKVTPIFNNDSTGKDKSAQPKTKKLTYELAYTNNPYIKINPNNGTVTIDKKYVPSREGDYFAIKVTAKDFAGNTTTNNEDNCWIAISGKALEIGRVEILQRATEYVYDENEDENRPITVYNVVAKDGDNVTSDELTAGNVQAVAFRPGTPEKISYTSEELFGNWELETEGYALGTDVVSFKSGNKAVQMDSHGYITGVSKVADKVTITATANDGGKKSASMKFNVKNAKPAYLGLLVEQQDDYFNGYYEIFRDGAKSTEVGVEDKEIKVIGTTNTVLRLSMVQKEDNEDWWSEAYQYADVKMTVSGGKVLKKADAFNRDMLIIANKETIKVTLENKSLKPSVKQTFVIKNNAAGSLTAFGKVSTTTKALAEYSSNGQEIKYQLNVKDKVQYEYEDAKEQLYVMIQPDVADRSKKLSQYRELEERGDIKGYRPVEKDGSFKIWFDRGNLPTGTYKLQLTFGKVEGDINAENYGSFIAMSKPQTVSVKINASKTKVSFKPATTLTMSLKDKASVILTGSGKNYDWVEFEQLKNINGYGTSNDEEKFTTYFDLESVWNDRENKFDYAISLKNDLTVPQITFITGSDKKAQNARTAYINYRAGNRNPEITTHKVSGTAKITVKFVDNYENPKPAASYSMASTVIVEGNKNTAVSVTSAKKPANILYAAVSDSSDGNFDIGPGNMLVYGDTFILSSKNNTLAVNKSGYTVKVKVIPEGVHASLRKDIDAARDAYSAAEGEAKADAEKAYKEAILGSKAAIELTTKVKVVAKDDKGTKKIAIAASELKKDSWNYYSVDKNYWSRVYYTKTTCDSDISKVEASFKTNDLTDLYKDVISFGVPRDEYGEEPGYDENGLFFDIVVNKDELAKAEAKQQEKGAKYHAYGAAIDVKASVIYGKYEQQEDGSRKWVKDESVKADEFTFKVTLPKKPETGSFKEALAKVKAETAKAEFCEKLYAGQDYPEFSRECKGYPFGGEENYVGDVWTLPGPYDPNNWDEWYEEQVSYGRQIEADLYGYINGVLWQVHDAIYAMAPEESETDIAMVQHIGGEDWGEFINLNRGEFVAPTNTEDGKLVIRVQLTDNTIYTYNEYGEIIIKNECTDGYDDDGNQIVKTEYRETLSIELTIPKLGEEPSDVKDILKQYVTDAQSNKTYAKMPGVWYEDIFKDIIKEDGELAKALDKYPTLRFNIECPYEIYLLDEDMWQYNKPAYYAQTQDWINDWAWNDVDEEYYWDGTYDSLPGEYKFIYSYYDDEEGDYISSYLTPDMGWKRDASEEAEGYIAGILHVWGIRYGGDEVRVPFIFTIDKLDGLRAIESNIKVALGDKTAIEDLDDEQKKEQVKLTPSNGTTKEEIEAIFKAAYANPAVEASWGELDDVAADAADKSFVVKAATAPAEGNTGEGSIRCAIKLSRDGADDYTFKVEIVIPPLKSATEAVNAVKAAVIDDEDVDLPKVISIITPIVEKHLKNSDTAEDLTAELEAAIVGEVKAAILKAANDALTGQPYIAVYKQEADGDNKKDVFTFEPYTFKKDGKISYTLEVRALTEGLNGDSDEKVKVGAVVDGGILNLKEDEDGKALDVSLSKDPSLVTFKQAAAVIEEALKGINKSNDTTSEEVRDIAEEAIQNLDDDIDRTTGISVSHKETTDEDGSEVSDYTFTPATFTEAGSLKGTLVLERTVSVGSVEEDPDAESETITYEYVYTLVLPMLEKNKVEVVKTEIQRALQAVGVTNNDAGDETTEGSGEFKLADTKEAALIAEAVKVVKDSGYTIAHDTAEEKASKVTKKSTLNATGSAKVSFILSATDEGAEAVSEGGKFDVTITILKLHQSANQLKEAVKAELGKKYPNNEVTPEGSDAETYCETLSDAILQAVKADSVMKDTYTIMWAGEGLQVVKDDSDQITGYQGTLNIYRVNKKGNPTSSKPLETVDVSLTIASS